MIKNDLNRLSTDAGSQSALDPPPGRAAINQQSVRVTPGGLRAVVKDPATGVTSVAGAGTSDGSGADSSDIVIGALGDLTEVSRTTTTTTQTFAGISIDIEVISTVTMQDANGNQSVWTFAP